MVCAFCKELGGELEANAAICCIVLALLREWFFE